MKEKELSLLAIVDDWESLERYEDVLSKHFQFSGAPFGPYGVGMAEKERFDRILVDLTFEDMCNADVIHLLLEKKLIGSQYIVAVGEKPSDPAHHLRLDPSIRTITRPFQYDQLIHLLSES